jgi:L-cysteine/cystine lyase
LGIDFYAFTGHKWWCGPAGLGGLYVRPEAMEYLAPTFIGWRSITTDAAAHPTGWKPNGQRFEVATSNYPLLAGLRAAIAHQTDPLELAAIIHSTVRRIDQMKKEEAA